MKIEMRKTEDVTPYDKNPRKNDHAVSAVVESLKAFGFRQPIVVDAADAVGYAILNRDGGNHD